MSLACNLINNTLQFVLNISSNASLLSTFEAVYIVFITKPAAKLGLFHFCAAAYIMCKQRGKAA